MADYTFDMTAYVGNERSVSPLFHLRMEADPVPEVYSLRTTDESQSPETQ
jgi:hypothetical protein